MHVFGGGDVAGGVRFARWGPLCAAMVVIACRMTGGVSFAGSVRVVHTMEVRATRRTDEVMAGVDVVDTRFCLSVRRKNHGDGVVWVKSWDGGMR